MNAMIIIFLVVVVVICSYAADLPINRSDDNNAETIENAAKCEDANGGIVMMYEPGGEGLFRDPLEVLGRKFPPSMMLYSCELQLMLTSNQITDMVFTDRGKNTCTGICRQYRTIIRTDGSAEVTLAEAYCDYTGMTTFEDDPEPDLGSVCTCAYKVKCNRRTKIFAYLFQANSAGYLKVMVSGSSVPKDVT